jgi:cation/acetate symporter
MTFYLAAVETLALSIFGVVLLVTLGVTYWAARHTTSTSQFLAAGRGISGAQNGWAIAGDYMSASSFLGFAGLVFFFGVDAYIGLVAATVTFLPVLLLLAARMRNAGKYTMADVLTFRLNPRPARAAAALGTLVVAFLYLIAQMVGAGAVFQALAGIDFNLSVILTGAFMLIYVIFGGMLATTWVQIIKAVLLMAAAAVMTLMVLGEFGFNPLTLFERAAAEHEAGQGLHEPGLMFSNQLDGVSFGLLFLLGTMGMPHILMRFFTVPDAKAARTSVWWAVLLIGAFYLMIPLIGLGARAILGRAGESAVGEGGNLAAPALAEALGGGAGTVGGDIFLAVVSAVAFATILAVVAGLVISASGAMAHDLWSNVIRHDKDSDREEFIVARIAAISVGVLAIVVSLLAGAGFNVSIIVALTFSVAASANVPALLLALFWPRFNTAGAVTGILCGLVSALVLIILSPPVWPGPDSEGGPFPLAYPILVSLPVGLLGCIVGTLLSRERRAESSYHELRVRAETGLGAERAAAAH